MKLNALENTSTKDNDKNSYILFSTSSGNVKFEIIQKENLEGYTLIITNKESAGHKKEISVGKIISIYKVDYKNSTQYLLYDWSGGAHCCHTAIPVRFDANTQTIGEPVYIGYSEGLIFDKNNLFAKDDEIYLYYYDTRYAYFGVSGASSKKSFYPSFLKLKNGTLNEVNSEFKEIYKEFYNDINQYLINESGESRNENTNATYVYEHELPNLVLRYALGRLSGLQTKDEALKIFKEDYYKLFYESSKTNSPSNKEIQDIKDVSTDLQNLFDTKN